MRMIRKLSKSKSVAIKRTYCVAAGLYRVVKGREFVPVFCDRDGDYIVRPRDGGVFVSELYAPRSYKEQKNRTIDLWCYGYAPQPGDIVVDIGAGLGEDAVVFSKIVGDSGLVIAIEAHPDTFAKLVKTIKLNELTNVVAIQVAVTDKDGDVFISDDQNYETRRIGNAAGTKVPARTLDGLLREVTPDRMPDLIKMNIEGAELAALRGASEALGMSINWAISCHDFLDTGSTPEYRTHHGVSSMLQSRGIETLPRRNTIEPWVNDYIYSSRQ